MLSLDVFGFQKQPSSELYILLVAPEFGGLSAVYPLDFSPSDSRGSSVTFKPIDFNSLQLQLGNTLSKAIRDRMAVSDCLNFLGFLGLEELATEALIDAAAAGGYQSYPARELLRRKIPERLAKFFQFRQSISARFLGGTVAALGLVMGCLWIFNRQMRFAVWFGLVCVCAGQFLVVERRKHVCGKYAICGSQCASTAAFWFCLLRVESKNSCPLLGFNSCFDAGFHNVLF